MIRPLALTALVCICNPTTTLTVLGPVPEGGEVVIEHAKALCPRPLVGNISFIDGPISCGYYPPGHELFIAGCQSEQGCNAARIVVRYQRTEGATALREELGHFCLKTLDDAAAQRWGAQL